MIRKLRLKFVAVCMAMVTAVLAVVLVSLYAALQQNVEDLSRQVLRRVMQEDTGFRGGGPEIGVEIGGNRLLLPYFTASVWPDGKGNFSAFVTGGTYADLEDTEALKTILQDCLNQNRPEGIVASYRLRFALQNNGIYWKVAFVDMSMEEAMLQKMMKAYLKIAAAAFTLLLGVSVLLAWWTTRPVERAWRQQRQFLSDASHELKTPLTVILSNAELLEAASLDARPARWADNIVSEAKQMKSLVEEMLTLARADNMTQNLQLSEVSLSDVVADCALAFEPVAYEAGKPLSYTIAENIAVQGDQDRLRRLTAILLDNAVKYGAPGGEITVRLQKTDRQARLTVSNPGPPIPLEQLRRLFERFYRADASRGEQSGFGLGLPIAAAIASEHKGSLRAESDAVSTRFMVQIPLRNH
ncbi:MAG: HAMP domain-containing histidine kinase [Oscillibacter sp.]|nr:HAMP domain-containing histidine kinase [Oscillibacter sp.]MCI8849057.1 HAMP domain-containing histidine kinase [Oscillibacter sp.]